jgi:hypothetical protein
VADRGAQFRTQCRFTLGDQTYEYHGHLSAADALLIRQHAGLSSLEWAAALQMGDVAALVGLVLITKRQAGERVTWDEVVESISGDDDVWSLFASVEPLAVEEAPARKVGRKRTAKDEAEPAVEAPAA